MSSSASSTAAPPTTDKGNGLTLAIILSFMLLIGVDSTIVNMALPQLKESLGFSTADLSWVLNAYTLTFGGLLLLGGRLGDVLGRRSVFVAGVLVFTLASLLGGLATTSWWLLGARALQGVGAALAAPSTMALIVTNFEGQARARAFAVFSAVMGAGASVGLVIGGVLTDLVSWRWVLFINVPLGIAVALLAPRYVKQPDTHPAKFDIPGAITSTIGMGSLVYAFIQVGNKGWSDRTALGAFIVAAVMLAVFFVIETRVSQPITPLHLFANPSRAGAYSATLLLTAAMFSVLFLLTQFQQGVLSFSPIRAGLAFLPMTLMQFAAVRLVPKLLPKLGARPLLVGGAICIAGGMAWLTQLSTDSNYFAAIFVPLFLIGLGVGISFPTLNMTIMSGVAPQDSGAASGLLQTLQWLGGTLGLAIFVTVLGSASRSVAGQPAGASVQEQANYALTHGITAAFLAAGISAAGALILAFFAPGKPAAKKEEAAKPAAAAAAAAK
ncbi:MAG TPA: MFS transporter [Dactylosporangium sp.]|nr:MFS transporter [Dactylosporangium sp.]